MLLPVLSTSILFSVVNIAEIASLTGSDPTDIQPAVKQCQNTLTTESKPNYYTTKKHPLVSLVSTESPRYPSLSPNTDPSTASASSQLYSAAWVAFSFSDSTTGAAASGTGACGTGSGATGSSKSRSFLKSGKNRSIRFHVSFHSSSRSGFRLGGTR